VSLRSQVNGLLVRYQSSSAFRTAVAALSACALIGAITSLLGWELPNRGYPIWLAITVPFIGLATIFIGLISYDSLVVITFSLIGFVRVEPAPFDFLVLITIGLGLMLGKLRWPVTTHQRVIQIGFWGFLLANLLSTVGVVPIDYSLRFLVITLYGFVICLYVVVYSKQAASLDPIVNGYLISAVVSVFLAVLGILDIGSTGRIFAESGVRARAFFKDENVFAPFLIPPLMILVDRVVHRKLPLIKALVQMLTIVFLIIGVVISFSRAAWINLVLSLLIWFLILFPSMPRKQKLWLLYSALATLAIIILVIQLGGFGKFVLERWSIKSYDEERFRNQAAGVVHGLSFPFGLGPGNWPNSHSLYSRTLAEHGLLGFATLAIVIVGLLSGLIVNIRQKTESESSTLPARVLFASLVGQLANSIVIDSIHWRHLWVLIGLAWATLEISAAKINKHGC